MLLTSQKKWEKNNHEKNDNNDKCKNDKDDKNITKMTVIASVKLTFIIRTAKMKLFGHIILYEKHIWAK